MQPVNSVVMTIIGINVVVVLPCFIVCIIISMVHTNFINIYYWSIDTYYIMEKNSTRCIVSVMYEKVITNWDTEPTLQLSSKLAIPPIAFHLLLYSISNM